MSLMIDSCRLLPVPGCNEPVAGGYNRFLEVINQFLEIIGSSCRQFTGSREGSSMNQNRYERITKGGPSEPKPLRTECQGGPSLSQNCYERSAKGGPP